MKNIVIAAVAALVAATPAVAAPANNFAGIHADITAGFNDVVHHHDGNDVNYAASLGVDAPLGTDFVIGAEATADNVFESDRQFGAAARVGYALTPRILAYGKVGYENWHDIYNGNLSGVRYGGGVQYSLTGPTYLKVEYRHDDYKGNVGTNGVLGGVGIRF